MQINNQQFLEVIKKAPLVSIDLIVRDLDGRILLGRRINEPARDMWFVPGGRIHKDECLDEAFARISLSELGTKYHRSQAHFIGVFENKYNTNFLETSDTGTHYVVLAYEIRPSTLPGKLPTIQHNEFTQATLGGKPSQGGAGRRFRRNGVVTVQIFTPFGDGLTTSDPLVDLVIDALEGEETGSDRIEFKNVSANEVGHDGVWHQTNVTAEFEYDRVK